MNARRFDNGVAYIVNRRSSQSPAEFNNPATHYFVIRWHSAGSAGVETAAIADFLPTSATKISAPEALLAAETTATPEPRGKILDAPDKFSVFRSRFYGLGEKGCRSYGDSPALRRDGSPVRVRVVLLNGVTSDEKPSPGPVSGKAAVALDRNGHWRINFTVRTWRDLGRPIQQWLSTAAGISYGFGTVR